MSYPAESDEASMDCSGGLAGKLLVHNALNQGSERAALLLKTWRPVFAYDAPEFRIRCQEVLRGLGYGVR